MDNNQNLQNIKSDILPDVDDGIATLNPVLNEITLWFQYAVFFKKLKYRICLTTKIVKKLLPM